MKHFFVLFAFLILNFANAQSNEVQKSSVLWNCRTYNFNTPVYANDFFFAQVLDFGQDGRFPLHATLRAHYRFAFDRQYDQITNHSVQLIRGQNPSPTRFTFQSRYPKGPEVVPTLVIDTKRPLRKTLDGKVLNGYSAHLVYSNALRVLRMDMICLPGQL